MPSQSTNWTRNAILVLAPLTVIALVAVFFGTKLLGSSDDSKTELAAADFSASTPTASATAEPTPSAEETGPSDLGEVKGVYTIKGPEEVEDGALVVFVVDGKKRLVVEDEKAPYQLRLKTGKLPNGDYTVSVLTSKSGDTSTVSTSTMTISNPAKKKAKKKATPTPTPTVTKTTEKKAEEEKDTSSEEKDASSDTPTSSSGTRAEKVLAIVNEKRAAAGCKSLKLNSKLTKAAQLHSEDMAENNYFDHTSQDGRSPFDRISDAGYSFSAAAENIAQGYGSASAVMTGWMNSEGHKENILNCTYTEMGLGWSDSYWTQTFGTPA